jgi:hypothetical protein
MVPDQPEFMIEPKVPLESDCRVPPAFDKVSETPLKPIPKSLRTTPATRKFDSKEIPDSTSANWTLEDEIPLAERVSVLVPLAESESAWAETKTVRAMFQFVESKVRLDGLLMNRSLSPLTDTLTSTVTVGLTVSLTLKELELPSGTCKSNTVGKRACTLEVLKFET